MFSIVEVQMIEWLYKILFSAELIESIKEIFEALMDREEKLWIRLMYIIFTIGSLVFIAHLYFK